jgi:hypothetical protein
MKRVEVVVEREEMNSTKFDGVKEWGRAGCLGLGKGRRSVSVGMSNENEVAVTKRAGDEPNRSDSASETPRTGRPLPRTRKITSHRAVTTVLGHVQSSNLT